MRRRALVFLSTTVASLALWSACSDYDDATIPPPDAAATSSSGSDATVSVDAGSPSDASMRDDEPAIVIEDASALVDSGCVDPCDCDGDGYLAEGCSDAAAPPGRDCDDHDPRRYPGQVEFFLDDTSDGDFNCDGHVDKGFTENVVCDGLTASCSNKSGFSMVVACGKSGDYYTCVLSGLVCVKGTVEQRKQACR